LLRLDREILYLKVDRDFRLNSYPPIRVKPRDQSVLGFLSEKIMQTQSQVSEHTLPTRKLSTQMRAVLLIFNADPYLMEAVSPWINLETESIYWDKIFKLSFSSGHRAATLWAYGIWTDSQPPRGDIFDAADSLSSNFKVAILEALCLRWGLRG
jgi:hypothetical protein